MENKEIEEIINLRKEFLSSVEVADVLGIAPCTFRAIPHNNGTIGIKVMHGCLFDKSVEKPLSFAAQAHTESCRQRFSVSKIQVCQGKHHIQFGGLFSQTSVSCFPIPEQLFNYCKNMFDFYSY